MYRRNRGSEQITLEYIDFKLDARLDRFEENLKQERKESNAIWEQGRKESDAKHEALMEKMEARIAVDRKEAKARLERERKESEARLAADREAAEARQQATESRLIEERREARREYNSQRFWMIANFVVLFLGIGGIFVTVLIAALNGGIG